MPEDHKLLLQREWEEAFLPEKVHSCLNVGNVSLRAPGAAGLGSSQGTGPG